MRKRYNKITFAFSNLILIIFTYTKRDTVLITQIYLINNYNKI